MPRCVYEQGTANTVSSLLESDFSFARRALIAHEIAPHAAMLHTARGRAPVLNSGHWERELSLTINNVLIIWSKSEVRLFSITPHPYRLYYCTIKFYFLSTIKHSDRTLLYSCTSTGIDVFCINLLSKFVIPLPCLLSALECIWSPQVGSTRTCRELPFVPGRPMLQLE